MSSRHGKQPNNGGFHGLTERLIERWIGAVDYCPWGAAAGVMPSERQSVWSPHRPGSRNRPYGFVDKWLAAVDACPWTAHAGTAYRARDGSATGSGPATIYTPEERRRRDASRWTLVQGVLAPLQFLVFLVSLFFVLRYLDTGTGFEAASVSIVIKTLVLYAIMVTGSLWEKDVFGRYLFAPAFFWEDAVSMVVIALHTAYLFAFLTGVLSAEQQMMLALAAYATYVVNAAQFIWKLRQARRDQPESSSQGMLSAAE